MTYDYTAPATPEAQQWNGHGTALKPSHEPIVIARKPLDGTIAGSALKHGCGGLNIEECRISTKDILDGRTPNGTSNQIYGKGPGKSSGQPSGRFPANFIHDGSPEVLAGFPNTKATGSSEYDWRRAGIPILSTR
jgi:hypothetical protein